MRLADILKSQLAARLNTCNDCSADFAKFQIVRCLEAPLYACQQLDSVLTPDTNAAGVYTVGSHVTVEGCVFDDIPW